MYKFLQNKMLSSGHYSPFEKFLHSNVVCCQKKCHNRYPVLPSALSPVNMCVSPVPSIVRHSSPGLGPGDQDTPSSRCT